MTTTAQPALRPTLRATVAAHLLPGLLLLAVWAVGGPLLETAGAPPVLGLLLAVPIVLLPCALLGASLARDAAEPGTPLLRFAGLHRLTARDLLTRVLPLGLASAVLPGAAAPLEPWSRGLLADRLPEWWDLGLPAGAGPLPVAVWIVCAVLLGPAVEELWFRGVLQPRLPGGRSARVVTGAVLFTVYHLWQPWAWPTVVLTALPLAVLRETRAGTTGAVLAHVAVNALVLPLVLSGWLHR